MKVSKQLLAYNSENAFADAIRSFSDSGAGIIHVRTNEIVRAVLSLRKTILVDGHEYKEWDVANGFRTFDVHNMYSVVIKGDSNGNFLDAITQPLAAIENAGEAQQMKYFVYVNPHYWTDNVPVTAHYLEQYAHALPAVNVRVILVTPDHPLPEAVNDNVVVVRFKPPGHSELLSTLNELLVTLPDGLVELSDDDKTAICFAGSGMSKESFEMYVSLSIVNAAAEVGESIGVDEIIAGINKGKTEIVNRNDILELYQPEDMENVGGMDNLKAWVHARGNCYSDEAAEYGIEPPSGIVLVGPPGTGKSLFAKAVAKTLQVPLVRLDFGRVFNSLLGQSESRIRTALDMAEAMAPCVLFADEIDKGLGGIATSGGGDGGTSKRILGSFLTWLQDNNSPVFCMVTANNIDALPPELLRRGRFDGIFSSSLPTDTERREILAIHLNIRGWDISKFNAAVVQGFVSASKGYVGSEIESAVKDGLIAAYNAGRELEMKDIVDALQAMVPLSKAFSKEIQLITAWSKANATPASLPEAAETNVTPMRARTRVRRKKDD